jgi:hypothetical protein
MEYSQAQKIMKAEFDQALCVAVGDYLKGIAEIEGRVQLSTPRIVEIGGFATEDLADGITRYHLLEVRF